MKILAEYINIIRKLSKQENKAARSPPLPRGLKNNPITNWNLRLSTKYSLIPTQKTHRSKGCYSRLLPRNGSTTTCYAINRANTCVQAIESWYSRRGPRLISNLLLPSITKSRLSWALKQWYSISVPSRQPRLFFANSPTDLLFFTPSLVKSCVSLLEGKNIRSPRLEEKTDLQLPLCK